MSKVKKIVALIVCVVCIFATLCISVSAANVSGITVSGYEARMYIYNYGTVYTSATNQGNDIFYHFTNPANHTVEGEFSAWFTLSDYIYGTIELSFTSSGKVYNFDAFNGLYNGNTGEKLCALTYDSNSYYASYTGYIPTLLELCSYFQFTGEDVLISIKITDIKIDRLVDTQSILNNQDKNADKITQNNDKNTDKIIDNQNQLQENEKNEAESSGQGSVDEISGAIEDKSAGFISAISNLVGSMSYDGTACAWSFPAIKLPAIEGVMAETQLTEEMPIDFEFWVNKIPSNILLLIRSLLTIALIGYCFKELYGTISYVLTLKGGGNNE